MVAENIFRLLAFSLTNHVLVHIQKNVHHSPSDWHSDNQKIIGKIWEGVKSIVSLRSSASPPPMCVNVGNRLVTDPTVISDSFNNYFVSIAEGIRKNIPLASKHFSSFLESPVGNSIFLSPTDSIEVMACIYPP